MQYVLLFLCLAATQILGDDCFRQNVKLRGKLLTRKKIVEDSALDCFSLCEDTDGCKGFVYFKKNFSRKSRRRRCVMYKKINKKVKKLSNVVSAVIHTCAQPQTGSATTVAVLSGTTSGSGTTAGSGTSAGSGITPGSGSVNYSQQWLRGEGPYGHVHEGLRLEARDGWVGIGQSLVENDPTPQVMVRRVDNNGGTVWTFLEGEPHLTTGQQAESVGFSVAQGGNVLYIGVGLWQRQSSLMKPAVIALDVATGNKLWSKLLDSQPKHGGVRSVIVDNGRIICTGYADAELAGFQFVNDEGSALVWELDSSGNLVKEKIVNAVDVKQGAKIRKDKTSGYIMTTTAWGNVGGSEVNVVALVKLSSALDVEWSKIYGNSEGASQVFDMLVDRDGNYLMGGHTTVGDGVVNWDYLALKVNSKTREVEWRKTFGQPRGFDPKWIHDEMYGVALDPAGNYLLLGGSGDEYTYSQDNADGWSSDIWVSYLVVTDTSGNVLHSGVYGNKEGNNAGEWLSVDGTTGEVMIYTDSDTDGGFGFLSLLPK